MNEFFINNTGWLVAKLYRLRKIGGRGLCSVEDCVELARLGLFYSIAYSQEKLLAAVKGKKCEGLESTIDLTKSKMDKAVEDYEEKSFKGNPLDK